MGDEMNNKASTLLCLKCYETEFNPTYDFKFTGKWYISYGRTLNLEISLTKKVFFGLINKTETFWVDDDAFIDINVCPS